MTIGAGCRCGAVRISFPQPPLMGRICWCRDCQYFAAGGGSHNAAFRTEGMMLDGEVRWYASEAESGRTIERGFCPTCGTHLLARAQGRTDLVMLRMGALDDSELVAPSVAIWTASAPSWACINEGLERFEGQPPPIA